MVSGKGAFLSKGFVERGIRTALRPFGIGRIRDPRRAAMWLGGFDIILEVRVWGGRHNLCSFFVRGESFVWSGI
jgi:hypothetical protein